MPNIRISPEQVRAVARRFRSESDNCRSMLHRMNSQVNSFQWEGMAKRRFMDEYQQWQAKMGQLINMLNNIAQQLDYIAVKFAQADHQGV